MIEARRDEVVAEPDARTRALSGLSVASFWVLPVIGPLVLRAFMSGRPFALHYFRYALIVQTAFVLGFVLGGLETLLRGQAEWTALYAIPVWLWSLYGSIVGLVAALSGRRRSLAPIPRAWLWAPGEC
jgi:xanthine/uracil permease